MGVKLNTPEGIRPSKLFPLDDQVRRVNSYELSQIEAPLQKYDSSRGSIGDMSEKEIEWTMQKLLSSIRHCAEDVLELKVGAMVITQFP